MGYRVALVKTGTFKISLGELDDGPKEMSGPLKSEWVRKLLSDTEVEPAGENDGKLDVLLTKNGSEVLVQGHLDLTVSVPCARTLDPAVYRLRPEIFLMLAPAGGAETRAHTSGSGKTRPTKGSKKGARGAKKGAWDADPELSDEDAARDTYAGDQIVLDDFLREFILLEIPMLPLREDLRDVPFEANPPLPVAGASAQEAARAASGPGAQTDEKPLDPRLSPLRDLKARLEKKE